MRLAEVDRGDTLAHRILIRMISLFAGYRLPDAARVAFYDQEFVGPILGEWTQKTMRGMEPTEGDAVLADYRTAPISDRFRAALVFLERMTREPDQLSAVDLREAMDAGLTTEELEDAAAVAALFNIIARNANALDFEIPSARDVDSAAGMLLRRGYT